MNSTSQFYVKAAVALFCVTFAADAGAQNSDRETRLEREIQILKDQVAQLQARDNEAWLNERRTEEIKALVHEVLADAETRAAFAEGDLTAGWNKSFFLASEDGNFLLKISGKLQTRYIWTTGDDISDSAGSEELDENEGGFQQRRTELKFNGHVFDPRLQYAVKGGFSRSDGRFILQDAFITYDWSDFHYLKLGQFKGRFLHEELVSSGKQQTVERSAVNASFTLSRVQGVEVGGEYDSFNWSVVLHDGREGANINWASDSTDIAVAGRAEILLAGHWSQFKDFQAWSDDETGLMIGAGFDYENGEGGSGSTFDWEHMFQYTVDTSLEMHPLNLYAAYIARHIEFDEGQGAPLDATDERARQWGILVQGGVFVIPDKLDLFARWEYLDFDSINELTTPGTVTPVVFDTVVVDDHQHIYTFGGNYYLKKHNVKLSLDVAWAPDGIRKGESGLGLLTSNAGEEDEFAIRGQFQLLF